MRLQLQSVKLFLPQTSIILLRTFTYLCDGQPLQWGSVVKYLEVYTNQH